MPMNAYNQRVSSTVESLVKHVLEVGNRRQINSEECTPLSFQSVQNPGQMTTRGKGKLLYLASPYTKEKAHIWWNLLDYRGNIYNS